MRGHALACGAVAAFLSFSGASAGIAATIHRCGPDGRTFSQTPCPSGEGRVIEVADERDADQRAEARDAARRTAAAADGMAAARERLDARRVRAPGVIPVTRSGDAEVRKPGKVPKKKKPVGDDGLTVPFRGMPTEDEAPKKPAAAR